MSISIFVPTRWVFVLAAALVALPVLAQTDAASYPVTLAGHAVMPSKSFIATPKNAQQDLQVSGKFTTGKREKALGSVEGLSAGRPTGVFLPFKVQPLQGHSGITKVLDGTFWILTDNGFGSKANSPDAMLYLNRYSIDFKAGNMKRLETNRPGQEMGRSASPRWPPGVVVKSGCLVGHPLHKSSNFRMRLQGCPVAVACSKFALAQGGVNFSVANAVNGGFDFTALAARHQVVFVHAGALLQQPAT